jgi:uroporphyrinogen decarboxylase
MKIKKDQMTPKERMQALEQGQPVDRIPCTPNMGVTMSSFIGRTTCDYYHSADVIVELEVTLYRELRHDSVGVGFSIKEVAEAMGSRVIYPPNGMAYLAEPALHNMLDISRIRPADPRKDGNLPLKLKALCKLQKAFAREVNVGSGIPGPLSVAADIAGTKNFLTAMLKYPEKVHELLTIVTETNINIIDILCDMGSGVSIADPVSSASLISAKLYREFSFPYQKKCIDRIRQKSGKSATIHVCGKSKLLWGDLVETGMSSFSLDNLEDLEEAKYAIGDKVLLIGNVPPVDIVRYGDYEDVVRESKECIRKAYNCPKGFILNTGCQVPVGTPIENIRALMDTVRSYGVHPVRPELW